jgi:hypothetical protein
MGPEEVRIGTRVRVRRDHRVESRRGAMGRIVGCYGGREYVAVDVRLSDGRRRLFWPGDLKEASRPMHWWRSLFEGS